MPYITHPNLYEPLSTQYLWRYQNFPKFADLIQNKKLFFSSVKQFDDPWEGFPSKNNSNPERIIRVRKNSDKKDEISEEFEFVKAKDFFGNQHESVAEMSIKSAINLRKTFFVNCWHMNDDESDSQWKIYGTDPCSLAIVSSFERLQASITDELNIYGSQVIYYSKYEYSREGNALYNVIHKRKAFMHEREFRLVYMNFKLLHVKESEIPQGIVVSIDLEKLIDRIVISPRAPTWFVNLVDEFLKRNNLLIQLHQSDLLKPFI